MESRDQESITDELDPTAPPRAPFEFELKGNSLVCKCHGRVVVTFAPDALAAFQAKHGK